MIKPVLLNEAELVQQLKEGDESAFATIYNQYKAPLILQAKRSLHAMDQDAATDMIQDLFANLWEMREKLEIHKDLQSYLYGALRNQVFKFQSHQRVEHKYITDFASFLETSAYTTDLTIREQELVRIMEEAIAALPPKMKQVFQLSRTTQLNHREIATRLGITENTVKKHIAKAIKILKNKFHPLMLIFLHFF
ncbi:RNA polymerase sigma-70 factor, Bacteroides expansion family 1 [bacterium A37T11]|nr:RNA polymerase sigma-70 factor, Bacteroides expansion family 1 [bacterium A37T11]